MSKLIAITFKDHATAFQLRTDLVRMQQDYLLDLDDAVVLTRDEDGKRRLHQSMNLTAAGAVGGGWWGLLIGLLFFSPLAGTAIGAASGALAGKFSDIGIEDRFMQEIGKDLVSGHATVFVLVRDLTEDKVLQGLDAYRGKGRIVTTSLSGRDEDALRSLLESPAETPSSAPMTSAAA